MAKKLNKMDKLALEVLANWRNSQGERYLRMPHQERLIKILDMGYVEQLENVHTGFKAFRITEAGAGAIGRADLFAGKAAAPAQPAAAGTLWQGVEPGAMVIASTEGWTPAEPGSDAKDEYTRDEEQARLIARIRELEEAIEPFADAFRAYREWSVVNGAQGMTKWLYYRCDDDAVEANYKAANEALAEAQEERG